MIPVKYSKRSGTLKFIQESSVKLRKLLHVTMEKAGGLKGVGKNAFLKNLSQKRCRSLCLQWTKSTLIIFILSDCIHFSVL